MCVYVCVCVCVRVSVFVYVCVCVCVFGFILQHIVPPQPGGKIILRMQLLKVRFRVTLYRNMGRFIVQHVAPTLPGAFQQKKENLLRDICRKKSNDVGKRVHIPKWLAISSTLLCDMSCRRIQVEIIILKTQFFIFKCTITLSITLYRTTGRFYPAARRADDAICCWAK